METEIEHLRQMFRNGIRCVERRRRVVYVTVAISTGYRLFQLLDELHCTQEELKAQHPDRYLYDVIEPNLFDARSWADQARSSFPGRVVLDPSQLTMPTWTQPDYNSLWDEVIDEFVDVVVATPRWAFSRGARKEVEKAIRTRRPVVDLTGREMPTAALLQHDERARAELRSWGWLQARIDRDLPPLDVEPTDEDLQPDEGIAWADAFGWVHRDLNDYGRDRGVFTPEGDDERTRLGLHHERGWGTRKMRYYWNLIQENPITTNTGRVELGSFVGASVGMLRSVWRVHGPLTDHAAMQHAGWKQRTLRPAMSATGADALRLGEVETDVWSWIQREHSEMRMAHTIEWDDERTRQLANGDPGAWEGELWREYWDFALHHGLDRQEGKNYLGKFVTCAFRILESTVRLYGEPKRIRSGSGAVGGR